MFEEIQKQFNLVLEASQEGFQRGARTDVLFERWYKAKKHFIDAMNGQLIVQLSEPIHLKLSEAEAQESIESFLRYVKRFGSRELYSFCVLNQHGLLDNRIKVSTDRYNEGDKLSKVMCKEFTDVPMIDNIRCALSQLIQENTVEGIFCISVHPLDFLSLSENRANWRSCHALDGDYRSGNLSWMCDPNCFIAYIKSEKGDCYTLPRFPEEIKWNNKKWRCLFWVDSIHHVLWGGKPYPFESTEARNTVLDLVKQCHNLDLNYKYSLKYSWWRTDHTFRHAIIKDHNFETALHVIHLLFDGRIRPITDLLRQADHPIAFCDCINSHDYDPDYAVEVNEIGIVWNPDMPKFAMGADVPCPCCGGKNNIVTDSDVMMCQDCYELRYCEKDDVIYCEECGKPMRVDSKWKYKLDDTHWLCWDCYHARPIQAAIEKEEYSFEKLRKFIYNIFRKNKGD